MYQFDRKEYEKRMEWYQDARFGMFIHWGLYSIPARGEWVRSVEEIPEEEYLPFMKEFDARDYNPKQWAKEAKAAGMKYVVLTAKHHDGFFPCNNTCIQFWRIYGQHRDIDPYCPDPDLRRDHPKELRNHKRGKDHSPLYPDF